MKAEQTGFRGLLILEPKVFGDERGYFMETYKQKTLLETGVNVHFLQDNQSSSRMGVLRGLHYQNAPYPQTKLIRVLRGGILDIVVDLRKDEPTWGKHFSVELSEQNKRQLLIPKGFAHGFVCLSERAEVFYKCDEYYHPEAEGGIIYNDPSLGIDWRMDEETLIISEKDRKFPLLRDAIYTF